MRNTWCRLYAEFSSDPKVQMMPEPMQRRLVMLFCEHCAGDGNVTFDERHRSFHWRISDEELAATKVLFIENGFIGEEWNLLNWNKRQFVSDSSADRTRRYRERKRASRERHSDGDVTKCDALDTESDSDTEHKSSSAPASHKRKVNEFFRAWNDNRGKLPEALKLTLGRQKQLAMRINEGLTLSSLPMR